MATSKNNNNQTVSEQEEEKEEFSGKQLTAKAVNKAIDGIRFTFGMSSKIANSGLDFSQSMASYFSGVNTSTPVGDTLFACGQTLTSKALDRVQELIAKAEKAKAEKDR